MSRRILLPAAALCVAAAACHSEAPPSPEEHALPGASAQTTTAAPSASSARRRHARDAGAPLDALCTKMLNEEKLDESATSEDRSKDGPRFRCWSAGRAAWALRAEKAGAAVKRTILFASEDGARARQVATLAGVEWPPVFGHGGVYDFDGDGTPELVAIVAKDVRTYAPADRIFVTMKKGAIAPYPTGASFLVDGLADVDHDGRPDLRVSLDVGKATTCAATDPSRVEVEFLAHALAGGKFSLDDAVARGWAEKRCPAMPAPESLFTAPASPDDPGSRDLSLSQVACERMRGKSAEAVVAELGAACAPFDDATKKCGGPCRHLADAIAVAKLAPPLALK